MYKRQLPPAAIISAVERAKDDVGGRSDVVRLTAADVAAAGGVDLDAARYGLTQLASALAGVDGVSVASNADGDLVYSFPAGVRRALAGRSWHARGRDTWNAAKPALATAGRVTFGVALITSVVAVYAAIFALQASSSSDDNRGRSSARMPMFNPYFSPLDLFFPRRYYYYGLYDPWYRPPPMSFPEALFSFAFGDGDPNKALPAARTRALAEVIRANGGAVVAEQLAPYLDPPADLPNARGAEFEGVNVDESWVLPACLELGGRPEVADDGTIVYVFDELQARARNSPPRNSAQFGAILADASAIPLQVSARGDDAALSIVAAGAGDVLDGTSLDRLSDDELMEVALATGEASFKRDALAMGQGGEAPTEPSRRGLRRRLREWGRRRLKRAEEDSATCLLYTSPSPRD